VAAILVTDGQTRPALAIVRSLGRAGHAVTVCAGPIRSLAGASRHATARETVSDPLRRPDEFADEVARIVHNRGVEVVIPVTEASALALLPRRGTMPGVITPFPALDIFRRISDKRLVLDAAPSVGIAVPAQVVVSERDGLANTNSLDLPFPVVLKPARSVGETGGQREAVSVRYARDATELHSEIERLPAAAFPLLVQQQIVGPGVGIFLLVWKGETLAVFAHRRIREYPPSGGGSVYRESIAADPALVQRSRSLLDRFDWEGVAMVEYKIDAQSGTAYLMEVNGRFWGSLQLAIDAGVDFPAILVDAALGRKPVPRPSYRIGVRSRWWLGDFEHLLARLRRSPHELALPPDAPGRGRTVVDFLKVWRPGDQNETFRFDDPWPFFRESADWANRRLLKRFYRTPSTRRTNS
jgi:biotin carboxylase